MGYLFPFPLPLKTLPRVSGKHRHTCNAYLLSKILTSLRMKSILCAIYLALLENLNTLWHNTKYMYFSFEHQKRSELNSLESLHVFFAFCHITDVREVDVENRKHQYC